MEILSKINKQAISKKNPLSVTSSQIPNSIISMTKGWQCCKCKEEMYRDENYCNWCKHPRCKSCRSFQV